MSKPGANTTLGRLLEAEARAERAEAENAALRALLDAIPDWLLRDDFYGKKAWAANIRALREGK